jgi:hypothetical protein
VSQSNTIFQGIINAHFPTLNNRKPMTLAQELRAEMAALPALDDDEVEFVACDSCGEPSTHEILDPGDPSVGYGSGYVPMCDDCHPRRSR